MGVDSQNRVGSQTGAVFLSYASQDADAAQRICAALRAAGIEVWFDQSELRGGDAWDRQIRKQIHDCALFVPVISAHSDARREGYFRREWKLAADRTADMAEDVPFLLPVVVDGTPDATARVPDRFREVQWSRIPDGHAPLAFIERVQRLLTPAQDQAPTAHVAAPSVPDAALRARRPVRGVSWSQPVVWVTVAVVVFAALGYFVAEKVWISKYPAPLLMPPAAPTSVAQAAFAPPLHSIAVLPFVNLSGDASQDYFSDGLTEELLNSLAEIEGLQVAARTSSFSFREHPDIAAVAHKLNVGAVLEGSVRRSAHTVRVTAQLINAVTGFHLWSKTYDRDLGDVLKLQTEIATAVANSLKITLLGDVSGKIEMGGTHNPAALDAYLRGVRQTRSKTNAEEARVAIDSFDQATHLDPDYALAFAARSIARSFYVGFYAQLAEIPDVLGKARADAERAIALAPELGEAHLALALFLNTSLDFARADGEFERARALAPGNAQVLYQFARFAARAGRAEAALAAAQRGVALDPLNVLSHSGLGDVLLYSHRYNEAIVAYTDAIAVDPAPPESYARRGWSYYLLGNLQLAQSSCQMKPDFYQSLVCLAVTLDKLGRHGEAEAVLAKLQQIGGDAYAYQFVQIHAQWGNKSKALDWLDTAVRVRDTGLTGLKTDPLLDPVRQEPRFQAIERGLRFPN